MVGVNELSGQFAAGEAERTQAESEQGHGGAGVRNRIAATAGRALSDRYMVDYDETQAIGRRYRRQDEIGTPLCVTVDFDTLEDQAVTIRDRDTTEQVRVPIADVVATGSGRVGF